MGKQHVPRSLLSGRHALYKYRSNTSTAPTALKILLEAFGAKEEQSQAADDKNLSSTIAGASAANTLIVPRKGSRLPYHVLPNSRPQPWELLPMRAAALKQYPDLFGEACMFFSNLQTAVRNNQPHQLVRCTKASLDLAKLLRNLGILSGFEVVQKIHKCKPNDYIWPPGTEPDSYDDLALYHHLYLRLALRWDALKPVWVSPTAHALQQPLTTSDALPLAVKHLSRPSCPLLMTPADVKEAQHRLQSGISIMYHHQLGLTCDAVTQHHQLPALGLAFLALPWVQTAQIKAALKSKAASEAGVPLDQTIPLTRWRLTDWVQSEMSGRQAQLAALSQDITKQEARIKTQVDTLNTQDVNKAQQALQQGADMHRNVVAFGLLRKLTQASGQLELQGDMSSPAAVPVEVPASKAPGAAQAAGARGRGSLFGGQSGEEVQGPGSDSQQGGAAVSRGAGSRSKQPAPSRAPATGQNAAKPAREAKAGIGTAKQVKDGSDSDSD